MSKKMKGVVYEDVKARFKHQTLVQDYHVLQQETEAARSQLEAMKQKKQTLQAEVRFLRRRHKFLLKTKLSNPETTQYWKNKEKVNPKKAATLPNLPLAPYPNQRGKMGRNVNSHGVNSAPMTEFNQKENGFGGEKVSVRARAPIFDLNQISMEEEEMQEGFDDQRKEQQNDLMLTLCRNVGDGSTNRAGKRKISWQDPVALRV